MNNNHKIYDAKDINPVCPDCIYCRDTITEDRERKFYCERNMIEEAPKINWNCFKPYNENYPF